MKREDEKIFQKAMNLFLVLFLVIGSVLGGTAAVLYRSTMNDIMIDLRKRETNAVGLEQTAVQVEFNSVANDALFLAGQNELIRFLDTGDRELLRDIQAEHMRLANINKTYDQIRFLDAAGNEVVRTNFDSGSALAVPENKLQNKRNRYYFTDCFALDKDAIFASPMDLNVENGAVERPLKPMIRIGTPVFDSRGNKKGILLINYKASYLLDRIIDTNTSFLGTKMLLNPDGYWLLGPSEDKRWGFMFPDRAEDTFARDFPEEWQRILETGDGQFSTDNGLFSFVTICPLLGGLQYECAPGQPQEADPVATAPSRYFWILLSRVPPDAMKEHAKGLLLKLFLAGGGLFLFIAAGAWHLAMAITRRRIYQAQLVTWAMYDPLTGLPNRKLFHDTLTAAIAHARRHERRLALLYIDLDGFKAVNDTHGHKAGDDLLIQVGERLTSILRKSDTVARLGGDEFAVILAETGEEAAMRVGDKIIETMGRPFELGKTTASIGASVGIAICPNHGKSEEVLIKCADQAMYRSKEKGKSTCTSASTLDD
jgi:diguanylate cyclase (GGDEF)-like protein